MLDTKRRIKERRKGKNVYAMTRNFLLYQYGANESLWGDPKYVKQYVQQLEKQFHFIAGEADGAGPGEGTGWGPGQVQGKHRVGSWAGPRYAQGGVLGRSKLSAGWGPGQVQVKHRVGSWAGPS